MTEYIRSCIERCTFTSMSSNMWLLLGSVIDENDTSTSPMVTVLWIGVMEDRNCPRMSAHKDAVLSTWNAVFVSESGCLSAKK